MLTGECWQCQDVVGLGDTLSVRTTTSHHTPTKAEDVDQEWNCKGEGFLLNFNYNLRFDKYISQYYNKRD